MVKKTTMTRNEQRLEKAKKLYPVGTSFVSKFGATDTVREIVGFSGKKLPSHYMDKDGDIYVFGKYESRLIYDGSWAKILKVVKGSKVDFRAKLDGDTEREFRGEVVSFYKDRKAALVDVRGQGLQIKVPIKKLAIHPWRYGEEW